MSLGPGKISLCRHEYPWMSTSIPGSYFIPRRLFPEILCLTLAMKYQMILVQEVMSVTGKYPQICLYKHNKVAASTS